MPIFDNAFDCKLYINYRPGAGPDTYGWAMIYHLLDQSWTAARETTAKVAEAVTWLLGDNCWCEWAETVRLADPPEAWPDYTTPLSPLGQFDAPHNPGVTLMFRFETRRGLWANHHYHGFANSELVDNEWIRAGWMEPIGPVARPAVPAAASKLELWNYAMALLRDRTCSQRPATPGPGGTPRWQLDPWDSVIFIRKSFQWVGHGWRRVSWEADLYDNAAHFTPCGSTVSVLHTCYSAPCSFYVGDSGRRIRFYWSAPGAAVIDRPTIFWGWAKDKKIINPTSVGETPGKPYRTYSLGLSWGVAPALGIDGTPADFLGQTILPWMPSVPTPFGLTPPCDMPAPIPILVDNDPAGDSNANTLHITFASPLVASDMGGNHVQVEVIGAGIPLTVQPSTGGDVCADVGTITFAVASGFVIEGTTPGKAGVSIALASHTTAGIVGIEPIVAQRMGRGPKSFEAEVILEAAGYATVQVVNRRSGSAAEPQGAQLEAEATTLTLGKYGSLVGSPANVVFSEKEDLTSNFERGFNLGTPGIAGNVRWGQNGIWTNIKAIEVIAGHVTWIDGDYAPLSPAPLAGPSPPPPLSGGVQVGGLGIIAHGWDGAFAGGVEVGGLGTVVMSEIFQAAGGVEVGGLGTVAQSWAGEFAGGVEVGGVGDIVPYLDVTLSGGVQVGGLGAVVQTWAGEFSGGVEVGGEADIVPYMDLTFSGGVEVGGLGEESFTPGSPPPPPTPGTDCADAPTLGLDTDYSYDGDTTAHWFAIPTSTGSDNIHVIITGTSPGVDYQLWSDCPATTLVFQNGVGGRSVCRQWSGNGSLNYLRIGPQPHESGFGDYTIRFEAGPCP